MVEFDIKTQLYKFGVTAWSFDDAMSIIEQKGLPKDKTPPFGLVSENVTLWDLDKDYIRPFAGDMKKKGIWLANVY